MQDLRVDCSVIKDFTKKHTLACNFFLLRLRESSPSSQTPISCQLISIEPLLFHV